jgi:hypothetical protein
MSAKWFLNNAVMYWIALLFIAGLMGLVTWLVVYMTR